MAQMAMIPYLSMLEELSNPAIQNPTNVPREIRIQFHISPLLGECQHPPVKSYMA